MTRCEGIGRRDIVAAALGATTLTFLAGAAAQARPVAVLSPGLRLPTTGVTPRAVPVDRTFPMPVTTAQLAARIDAYLTGRSGTVGVAVYDRRTGVTFAHRVFRNETLSTVKVVVLVALLRRAEAQHRELTSTERSFASAMIRYSDNGATDELLESLGVAAVQRAADALGMRYTHVHGGSTGWWGYSTTWPGDLVRAMGSILWGGVVTDAHRSYVRGLMAGVTSSQRWGVCDPPLPSSVRAETKNGWGAMASGYRLNSVGHITGNGRNYTMAILSRSPAGFGYGRTTVNGVASVVYRALYRPLR